MENITSILYQTNIPITLSVTLSENHRSSHYSKNNPLLPLILSTTFIIPDSYTIQYDIPMEPHKRIIIH